MPIEFEIKYVLRNNDLEEKLKKIALKDKSYSVVLIEQFYLPSPARVRKLTVLIKKCTNFNGNSPVTYKFAYKPKVNGSVVEIETKISKDDFELLARESKRSLVKVRFQEEKPIKNEHWIVDFFKSNGTTYFVQAECEIYGGINRTPKRFPHFVMENILLTAAVGDATFSSRSLCDVEKSRMLYEQIAGGTYGKEEYETLSS